MNYYFKKPHALAQSVLIAAEKLLDEAKLALKNGDY